MKMQKLIIDYLFNEDMKEKLLKALNDAVDIPFISETTEAKILNAIWSTIEEVLKKAILKG